MLRVLVKLALAAALLWAIWAFVPMGGRTLAARWRAAPDAQAFAASLFAEARRGLAGLGHPDAASRTPRREARAGERRTHDPRPAEKHTEADRRAVDRIVAEHLSE